MMPQRKRNVRTTTTTTTTTSSDNNNSTATATATMNPTSSSSFDIEQQQRQSASATSASVSRMYPTRNTGLVNTFFFRSSSSYGFRTYNSMVTVGVCGLFIFLFVFFSSDSRSGNSSSASSSSSSSSSPSSKQQQQQQQEFRLWSTAFEDGQTIPMKYAREGQNLSPPLFWDARGLLPSSPSSKELSSFVLIVDDPDAPTKNPWVHWILYNIPPTIHSLPEGFDLGSQVGGQNNPIMMMKQGQNSWKLSQYDGPQPPSGQNHLYIFTIYALDTTIIDGDHDGLVPGAGMTKDKLLSAMEGHILDQAKWTGRFQSK